MKTKQLYCASNKFLIIKQINTLKKAVYEILSDSNSSKNNEAGGNRDKISNNEAKGQNRAENNNDNEAETQTKLVNYTNKAKDKFKNLGSIFKKKIPKITLKDKRKNY
jgi:hypothetical protein